MTACKLDAGSDVLGDRGQSALNVADDGLDFLCEVSHVIRSVACEFAHPSVDITDQRAGEARKLE